MRINALSKSGMVYVDKDEMYRIIHSDGEYCLVAREGGDNFKIRMSEVNSLGDMSTPSALVNFAIVEMEHGEKDVLITVHRVVDLERGIDKPFVISRQGVIDVFMAPLATSIDEIEYGLSISNLTCPGDFNMESMLDCKRVLRNYIISVYPNDTIDSMMKLLANQKTGVIKIFDSVIDDFKREFNKNHKRRETLYDFLFSKYFIHEFDNAHGIKVLGDDIIDSEDVSNKYIHESVESIEYEYDDLVNKLEHLLGYKINVIDIVEYTPRLDMTRLKSDRFLYVRNYVDSDRTFVLKYLKGPKVMFIPPNQKLMFEQLVNKVIRD